MIQKQDLPQIIARLFQLREKGSCRFDFLQDRLFSELCTFRIGGRIENLFVPWDVPSLCLLLGTLYPCGTPYLVLGGGSNLLPPDGVYKAPVILTSRLRELRVYGRRLYAACGTPLNDVILAAARSGLSGLELLYGIPATVGGAIFMNAGANGREISDCLESVELYNAEADTVLHLTAAQMRFSYRDSLLQDKRNLTVLGATFLLSEAEPCQVLGRVREVTHKRLASQPLQYPSAGSAFKRPRMDTEAWRLIDLCGLRGYRCGGAQISEKHAGFIVNRGGATAKEVRSLINHARRSVLATTGILLIPEIEILNNGK